MVPLKYVYVCLYFGVQVRLQKKKKKKKPFSANLGYSVWTTDPEGEKKIMTTFWGDREWMYHHLIT